MLKIIPICLCLLSASLVIYPGYSSSLAKKEISCDSAGNVNSESDYNYFSCHLVEKVYLQFDKPYYAIRDTIYFKAYVTLGTENKLSALSGILYAELITPQNKIARSLKLQITAGTAVGDFTLADSLKSGSYLVRAYTSWMRNEGEDGFFEKVIPIGGIDSQRIPEAGRLASKQSISPRREIKSNNLQFFPEGGSLVFGNYSKIAFKAVGPACTLNAFL